MDKKDMLILEALQRDSSLSVSELAKQINLSTSSCWRRIQTLEEDSIISSKVTLLNPKKIGLVSFLHPCFS